MDWFKVSGIDCVNCLSQDTGNQYFYEVRVPCSQVLLLPLAPLKPALACFRLHNAHDTQIWRALITIVLGDVTQRVPDHQALPINGLLYFQAFGHWFVCFLSCVV